MPTRPAASWAATIAALIAYPLAGPANVALVIALPLALIGVFQLGLGGLLYYSMLATWWLPALYTLLGPPFLLTGLAVAIVGRLAGRTSLAAAIACAALAFLAWFAGWTLVTGDIESGISDARGHFSDFTRAPGSVVVILAATAASWMLARAAARLVSRPVAMPGARPGRAGSLIEGAAALAGGLALAALFAFTPQNPEQAWEDCNEGGWDERISGCTRIIELGEAESAERRTTAYLRRGFARQDTRDDYDGAIADYSEAIKLDPDSADAFGWRALVHAERGDHDATIADVTEALRRDPNALGPARYRIHRARGAAFTAIGQVDLALADHTAEIGLTPHYADGYLSRAAAYLARGDDRFALDDFNNAIRVEEYRPAGYVGRGSIYLRQGDEAQALADFDEAIRRQPDVWWTSPAYRMRGVVLERQGDEAGALAAYEKALALDPRNAEAKAARDRLKATP